MYVFRLVNIQDHTAWMSRFATFEELLDLYGAAIYQQRMWQAEVWWLPEVNTEYAERPHVLVTMHNGRWRFTGAGENHFAITTGGYPELPPDRR